MKHTSSIILSATLQIAVLLCVSAKADDAALRPFAEVRTLAAIQNGLTHGQSSGLRVQRVIIRSISKKFVSAPPEIWSDNRNAAAAIRFLLSGGDPAFGRNPAVREALPQAYRQLFTAAMAFTQGQRAAARRLLADIDPRKLLPVVGGHVALVSGILLSSSDPAKAQRRLEDARLLGSGTLVEEAALRRQVEVAVAVREFNRFRSVADTYIRHYQKSVYAGVFRQSFSRNVLIVLEAGNKPRVDWLVKFLKRVRKEQRQPYYTAIAREAVLRGRSDIVAPITELGLEVAGREGEASAQLTLYQSAMSIFAGGVGKSEETLSAINVERLSRHDAAIHQAASSLVRRIEGWPKSTMAGPPPPPNAKATLARKMRVRPLEEILEVGRVKLAAATELLAQ